MEPEHIVMYWPVLPCTKLWVRDKLVLFLYHCDINGLLLMDNIEHFNKKAYRIIIYNLIHSTLVLSALLHCWYWHFVILMLYIYIYTYIYIYMYIYIYYIRTYISISIKQLNGWQTYIYRERERERKRERERERERDRWNDK